MENTNCYFVVDGNTHRIIEVIPDWQQPDVLPMTLTSVYEGSVYAVRGLDRNNELTAPGWVISDQGERGTFVRAIS